jgi:hypothetical protein
MKEQYPNCKASIEHLIDRLPTINLEYGFEKQYIGEAISYLRLFLDILDSKNEKSAID